MLPCLLLPQNRPHFTVYRTMQYRLHRTGMNTIGFIVFIIVHQRKISITLHALLISYRYVSKISARSVPDEINNMTSHHENNTIQFKVIVKTMRNKANASHAFAFGA